MVWELRKYMIQARVCALILMLTCISGCEVFDPDSDEPEPTPAPEATASPVPTGTPAPTETPFAARGGRWGGETWTTSHDTPGTGKIHMTIIPDHLEGFTKVWVVDTYTADGGGPFPLTVNFAGSLNGVKMSASGYVYNLYIFINHIDLEGFFIDPEHAQGTWHCSGAAPGDAEWNDHGVWTAEYLHD